MGIPESLLAGLHLKALLGIHLLEAPVLALKFLETPHH